MVVHKEVMVRLILLSIGFLLVNPAFAEDSHVELDPLTGKTQNVLVIKECEASGDLSTCYTANRLFKVQIPVTLVLQIIEGSKLKPANK